MPYVYTSMYTGRDRPVGCVVCVCVPLRWLVWGYIDTDRACVCVLLFLYELIREIATQTGYMCVVCYLCVGGWVVLRHSTGFVGVLLFVYHAMCTSIWYVLSGVYLP